MSRTHGVTVKLTNGETVAGNAVYLEKNFVRIYEETDKFTANTEIEQSKILWIRTWTSKP
jgi:hypothetical protein